MDSFHLKRIGYGAAFNEIIIQNTTLHKTAKNTYGIQKLEKEINFYRFCATLKKDLYLPKILHIGDGCISMEYYSDFFPLYKFYWDSDRSKQLSILGDIYKMLNELHMASSIQITQEILERDLLEEGIYKVKSRYNDIDTYVQEYTIETVNSIPILSFDFLLQYIRQKLTIFIKDIPLSYTLIHGDCQFNNILYSSSENKYVFIDPRGYFGKTDIFGLPHYDRAKILFALSGYDVFDNLLVDSLSIEKNNLLLPCIPFDKTILESIDLDTILMVSIWLGNAHCFKDNPAKAVLSHYYARFVGTLVYMSDKSFMK